jgi:hypothetical protein
MKMVLDFFALVGLCASIIATGFYLGYATYQPECGIWVASFTKECK